MHTCRHHEPGWWLGAPAPSANTDTQAQGLCGSLEPRISHSVLDAQSTLSPGMPPLGAKWPGRSYSILQPDHAKYWIL